MLSFSLDLGQKESLQNCATIHPTGHNNVRMKQVHLFFTFVYEYVIGKILVEGLCCFNTDMHNSIHNYIISIGMICKNIPGEKEEEEEVHDQRKYKYNKVYTV